MRKKPFGQKKKRVAFSRLCKWYLVEVSPCSDEKNLFQTRILAKTGTYKNQYMTVEQKLYYSYFQNHVFKHLGFTLFDDVPVWNNAKYYEVYEKVIPLDFRHWKRIEETLKGYDEGGQESEQVKACFDLLNMAFAPGEEPFLEDVWTSAEIEVETATFQPSQYDIAV